VSTSTPFSSALWSAVRQGEERKKLSFLGYFWMCETVNAYNVFYLIALFHKKLKQTIFFPYDELVIHKVGEFFSFFSFFHT